MSDNKSYNERDYLSLTAEQRKEVFEKLQKESIDNYKEQNMKYTNYKKSLQEQAYIWVVTCNKYDDDDEKSFRKYCTEMNTEGKLKYANYTYEIAPTTGTPHMQGCLYTKYSYPKKTILEQIGMKFSLDKVFQDNGAFDYALKRDKETGEPTQILAFEIGIKPVLAGQEKGRVWKEALEYARQGQIDKIDPRIRITCYSAINAIARENLQPSERLEDVCGVYIYGLPGTGKSQIVMDFYGLKLFEMTVIGDFNGYRDNHEVVLMNEFEKDHGKKYAREIKLWTDKYPFNIRPLYGVKSIRPRKFIFTANYSLEQCVPDLMALEAIKRRCIVIYVDKKLWTPEGEHIRKQILNALQY